MPLRSNSSDSFGNSLDKVICKSANSPLSGAVPNPTTYSCCRFNFSALSFMPEANEDNATATTAKGKASQGYSNVNLGVKIAVTPAKNTNISRNITVTAQFFALL